MSFNNAKFNIDSIYNNTSDFLQQYSTPMRSTSCIALLPSSSINERKMNPHIDTSYSENNITSNSKKSTTRADILQSKLSLKFK